jgi:hypothetical protein
MEALCRLNPLAAYNFDAAITTLGVIFENALQETVESGSGSTKRIVARYKLDDMLKDSFTFGQEDPFGALRTMDGYEEVS